MMNNFFRKALRVNRFVFCILVPVTLLFLLVESYTYEGFLELHFFINSKWILRITYISIAFLVLERFTTKSYRALKIEDKIFKTSRFLFPFSFVLYFLMETINLIFYSNYVFSLFHIQPSNFAKIVGLMFTLFVIKYAERHAMRITEFLKSSVQLENILRKQNHIQTKSLTMPVALTLLIISVSAYTAINFIGTFKNAYLDTVFILKHANYSYEQKIESKWGILYKLISLVKNETETGSLVLIPEYKPPHSVDGRNEYYRYFLNDRLIKNYEMDTDVYLYDYVVLASGYLHPQYDGPRQGDYIWPNFLIGSDEIHYLVRDNDGNYSEHVLHSNYDPNEFGGKEIWGIIKIKK